MIIRNILGVIIVIFTVVILVIIGNNIKQVNNVNFEIKTFEILSENLNSLCSNPSEKVGYNVKIKIINENYSIFILKNELCLNDSNRNLTCSKFHCDFTIGKKEIIYVNKKNYIKNQFYNCFLEKINENTINISCKKELSFI